MTRWRLMVPKAWRNTVDEPEPYQQLKGGQSFAQSWLPSLVIPVCGCQPAFQQCGWSGQLSVSPVCLQGPVFIKVMAPLWRTSWTKWRKPCFLKTSVILLECGFLGNCSVFQKGLSLQTIKRLESLPKRLLVPIGVSGSSAASVCPNDRAQSVTWHFI